MYSQVNSTADTDTTQWFAIKTRQDFKAEEVLAPLVDDILFPKTTADLPNGKRATRALIPHVLFIRTAPDNALELEKSGRQAPETNLPFWIYRYPKSTDIQPIPERSIHLLRLLTATDATVYEVRTPDSFTPGQRVRITGGVFQGYEGYVKRIHRDRRVLIELSGLCLLLLPFIHPDLLQPLD